jgi:hypothetical protein
MRTRKGLSADHADDTGCRPDAKEGSRFAPEPRTVRQASLRPTPEPQNPRTRSFVTPTPRRGLASASQPPVAVRLRSPVFVLRYPILGSSSSASTRKAPSKSPRKSLCRSRRESVFESRCESAGKSDSESPQESVCESPSKTARVSRCKSAAESPGKPIRKPRR